MDRSTLQNDRKECIEDCLDCYRICTDTAMSHCLPAGGEHVEPEHFRLMLNCAELCRTTAGFLLSESEFGLGICALCEEVCEACADSCRSIGGMEDCVQACEMCAESCAAMGMQRKPLQQESALTHPKSLHP
jgi:hypothetical protein